jgi:hypothetical protein
MKAWNQFHCLQILAYARLSETVSSTAPIDVLLVSQLFLKYASYLELE